MIRTHATKPTDVVIQEKLFQSAFADDVSTNCQDDSDGGRCPRHALFSVVSVVYVHESLVETGEGSSHQEACEG